MSERLALPERLTYGEARATAEALCEAVRRSSDPVLDAAPLRSLDSAALAVLLACRREAQAQGKPLTVREPPAKLVQLARLYGVDGVLGLA